MMRRTTTVLLALALLLLLPLSAQSGAGNVRPQIEKVAQEWVKAYNAGDAAAVTRLYTADAILMAPGSAPGTGPKAVEKLIAADIGLGGKLALTTDEVVGSGDYAFETGSWVATGPDGKHLDHGPYVVLYKKVNGGWKLHRDMWNSSMPSK